MTRSDDSPLARFARAFTAADTDALRATLAQTVTAEVLGSGFGTETGPDDVLAKSVAHLLDRDEWGPLSAHVLRHDGDDWIAFVGAESKRVECAARVETADGRITRLGYLVEHFRPDELAAVDQAWRTSRAR